MVVPNLSPAPNPNPKPNTNSKVVPSSNPNLSGTLTTPEPPQATMKQLEAVPKGCALVLSDITAKHFYDPFSVDGVRVRGIKLEKIFNSNAKPMLLSLHFFREQSPSLGLSTGSNAGVGAGVGAGGNGGPEEEEDVRRSAARSEVDRLPKLVIYKAGDDLRKDVAVLQVSQSASRFASRCLDLSRFASVMSYQQPHS